MRRSNDSPAPRPLLAAASALRTVSVGGLALGLSILGMLAATSALAQPTVLMSPVGLSTSPRLDGAQCHGQDERLSLRDAASELAATSVFRKPRRPEITSIDPNNPPPVPALVAQADTEN